VLFAKSQTTLIAYPGGLGGNYTIPGSVASLDDYAFYGGSGLTNANIGNGLSSVGNNAFYYLCHLSDPIFLT